MRNCFVDAITSQKKVGETRMCDIVMGCNGKCASPEGLTVTPIRVLNPRQPCQTDNYYCGSNAKDLAAVTPRNRQIRDTPSRDQVKTDLRKVSVAICSRLSSNLDDADYRHEHSDVPKPPRDQVRMFPPESHYNCGYPG